MTKMFQKFEFPAWSCQIFTKEIKIPENQIRHHFRIHLGNPLCILLLTILGKNYEPKSADCPALKFQQTAPEVQPQSYRRL